MFADITSRTYTLDPRCVEKQITPRTTAIVGVHAYGQPCDIAALQQIADRHDLDLLYDAAHAFGVGHGGTPLTAAGRASVVSFHATKFINSFEGGAILTNDDELAQRCRLMRNFGFGGEDRVVYIGTNGKMTEICAAMGLTSLDAMQRIVATNRDHYQNYRRRLGGLPGIRLLEFSDRDTQNYQYVVMEIDSTVARVTRDELQAKLKAENILARRYFYPGCHIMEPYRSLYPNSHLWLPETDRIANRVLVLPTGTAVSSDDVRLICDLIRRQLEERHSSAAQESSFQRIHT